MRKTVVFILLHYLYCVEGFYFEEGCGLECYPLNIKSWDKNGSIQWDIPHFGYDQEGDIGPIQVRFILFNRENLNDPESFILKTTKKMYEKFDENKPIKILVHGWIGSLKSPFVQSMLKAYLSTFDYNIIAVDWEQESHRVYPMARESVPKIGEMLAEFIDLLHINYGIEPEYLHILGHSLGAHISGISGVLLESGTLGRITGLDPALPLFSEDIIGRLSKDSATFVDVIHTCGMYLGWFDTVGHVDFYPNRGIPIQPGCGLDMFGSCSHCRSYNYYSESINNPSGFIALPCDTWDHYKHKECGRYFVNMGENLPKNTTGVYYLITNDKAPFGRGMEDLTYLV